jgi:thymidylate synthase (FAD)
MRVSLVSHTANPVDAICKAIAIMMKADPVEYVAGLTEAQKLDMLREVMKSRLTGALEFATFEFLVEDVTRAFTHQLVRHRTFHFSQQSMRFFDARKSGFETPAVPYGHQVRINETVEIIRNRYQELIDAGCPIEDARSILPTNIHTKIMFGATFRGLVDLAEVRLCLQTQREFRTFMVEVKKRVEEVNPFLGSLLMIACQRSGQCEFKSIYDRRCPIQETLEKEGGNHGNSNKEESVTGTR